MQCRAIKRLTAVASAAALLCLLSACSLLDEGNVFSEHREFVREHLEDNALLERHQFAVDGLSLHYRSYGEARDGVIIWVHGTPGSWADVGRLLVDERAAGRFKWVLIDRPGWGESRAVFTPDEGSEKKRVAHYGVYPGFDQQSRYISPLIRALRGQHPDTPILLLGHSWGASLLPELVADNLQQVDGALLLAGGLSPELTRPRWYNRWSRYWPLRAIIGAQLRGSNVEMYALPDNLANIEQLWSQLDVIPMIIIQGSRDPLVDPANASFAKARLLEPAASPRQRLLYLEGAGHLLHMQHRELVLQCIEALIMPAPELCRQPAYANNHGG